MSLRRQPRKPPEAATATPDFAEDDSFESSLSAFDRTMRGLVHVPKSELDASLKREKKTKKKRSN